MNTLLKLFGLIHFTKLYLDTTKSMFDTAFMVIVAFVVVWVVAITFIVWFGAGLIKVQ